MLEKIIDRVEVRWEARKPKTGNAKYTHRVPVGGTIYLTDWFAEVLRTLVLDLYKPLADCDLGPFVEKLRAADPGSVPFDFESWIVWTEGAAAVLDPDSPSAHNGS